MKQTSPPLHRNHRCRGLTLIEALVASSVLLIGISAASSMSLALVTQEEISERANRVFNHIDDSVRLLQAGVDPVEISTILPPCPELVDFTIEPHAVNVPSLGPREAWWIKWAWTTTDASENSAILTWTGGDKDVSRQHGFYVYRDDHFLSERLARAAYAATLP